MSTTALGSTLDSTLDTALYGALGATPGPRTGISPRPSGRFGPSGPVSVRPASARPASARRGSAAASSDARLRLTGRGRVVVVLLALATCLGGAWLTGTATASEPGRGIEVVRHGVVPGDTMWALARSVAKPGEDVRDVVAELERLNHLSSGDLRVGQVILLPVYRG